MARDVGAVREPSVQRTRIEPATLAAALTRPAMLGVVWFVALLEFLSICVQLPQHATGIDFSIYYTSAVTLREGHDPYTTDFRPIARSLALDIGEVRHATDPPAFLICMEPFALMPERVAFYTWVGLNAIFFAAALVLLLESLPGLDLKMSLALVALAILYPPVQWHFLAAQSKIPIMLLLVLFIRFMEQGRDRVAGLCLALAGLLRIFPLLLVGYLVIQRRWRVLMWTLVGIAAGGLATVALFGLLNSLAFRYGVQLLTGRYWLGAPANIALGAAVSRAFWAAAGHDPGAAIDLIRRVVAAGAQAALLGVTVLATVRLGPGEDPDWRALGMWIVVSVLLSPTAWVHYMVVFLIPFAQMAAAAGHSRASERSQWAGILSYVMILLSTLPLMPAAYVVYSHFGRQSTRLFMSLVIEGWFVSAMLAYLATYSFTIDGRQTGNEPAAVKRNGGGREKMIAEAV